MSESVESVGKDLSAKDSSEMVSRPGISDIPEEFRKLIDAIENDIDLLDSKTPQSFGGDVQEEATKFSNEVLEKVKSKDIGETGEIIRDMLETIDGADGGVLSRVPVVGKLVNGANSVRRRYEKVGDQVDEMVGSLEKMRTTLVQDSEMFSKLSEVNVNQYYTIWATVIAGERKLEEFRRVQLPGIEAEASSSTDMMKTQRYSEVQNNINNFEIRLEDLRRLAMLSCQMAPQISLLQKSEDALISRINTVISLVIPAWKKQILIAIGSERLREANELQSIVNNATQRFITSTAERLHEESVKAARASQSNIIDMKALQEANASIVKSLEEVAEVNRQGREARQSTREASDKMRRELIKALNNASRSLEASGGVA